MIAVLGFLGCSMHSQKGHRTVKYTWAGDQQLYSMNPQIHAYGFSHEVDNHLVRVANLPSSPERDNLIVLLMDEMNLKERSCMIATQVCMYK